MVYSADNWQKDKLLETYEKINGKYYFMGFLEPRGEVVRQTKKYTYTEFVYASGEIEYNRYLTEHYKNHQELYSE